jgi:dipeptidyl-peptidase-4
VKSISYLAAVFLFVSFYPIQSDAQGYPTSWTDGTARQRFQAIYERGAMNGNRFSATWWPDSQGFSTEQRGRQARIHFDAATGEVSESTPPRLEKQQRFVSPNRESKLEIRQRGLFVINVQSGKRERLMGPTPEDVQLRNPSWSPSGKFLAVTESDSRNVRRRNMLVPSDPSYPGVREQQFARVGEKITKYRIAIMEADGKNKQWLPIESPEEGFYLGLVEWLGDSDTLLIEWLSRSRDQRSFFLASPDGQLERIFHETNPAWVVASQAKNSGLLWFKDYQQFIVVSETDGWRHAYRYGRDGKEMTLLTPGNFDLIERSVIDEEGGWFYFYASPDNATEKYLFRVPLDGIGDMEKVTPSDQPGTHDYEFSPDLKFAFHTVSTFDTPPITELIQVEGHKSIKVLESNQRLVENTKALISRPTEFLNLKIEDGTEMDAWLIKPAEFDESKKYPVFVYVYGEPHAQTVLNEWGAAQSHFLRVIADLGYLVVSIDNRGTLAPKGAAWRRAAFGSLGPLSTEDQAAALKALGREKPYVDLSRVGIWGWSGGGSNTLNALFRKPDDYHVGIAVVPKPQPHLYNAWFQEIFMRTREDNPEGYKQSAPINFAEGLKGKLLIVTGSGETNTHIQIIEGLIDRLVELGKPFDYMVYPNRNHGLREGPGTLVHVRMLIARYLLDNLTPGPK